MSHPNSVRARDLGVPFEGVTGAWNAITDIRGLEVGHTTLLVGESIRTGITAIHPRGKGNPTPVFAGYFSLNGNGEMTGTAWIEESGMLEGPVAITNTHSVGMARDAIIAWSLRNGRKQDWLLPVVAETYDGRLNDINAFALQPPHVFEALDTARGGRVIEGNVGGGTGMVCYGFKGGIGTSSRIVGEYTVATLVQANHGQRSQLRIDGRRLPAIEAASSLPDAGSIIVIVATDAPMLPHQLKALAKRGALGLGRTGAVAALSSGDLFLAFSTGNALEPRMEQEYAIKALGLRSCTPLYEGVVQATEEAIINALVAAETMSGYQGSSVDALPHDLIRQMFSRG